LLEKQIVTQAVKKFFTIYGNCAFITMITTANTCPSPQNPFQSLTTHSFKICFNINSWDGVAGTVTGLWTGWPWNVGSISARVGKKMFSETSGAYPDS
jgi:hypothetical protein